MLEPRKKIGLSTIGDRACLTGPAATLPQLVLQESVRLPDEDYFSLVLTAYPLLLPADKGSDLSSGGVPGALSSIAAVPLTRRLICHPKHREEALELCARSDARIQQALDGSSIDVIPEFRNDFSQPIRAQPMHADALDNLGQEVFGRQAFR